MSTKKQTDRLIDLKEVMSMTCISRSFVYALIKLNRFPKPVTLTEGKHNRCSRWSFLEVQAWIEALLTNRKSA